MPIIDYNNLFSQPLIKQMSILSSSGISITNINICSEEMSLEESLSSDKNLNLGACEASCFKIRIADMQHNFVGEWLNVEMHLYTDYDGYLLLQNGDYFLLENGDKLLLTTAEATAKLGRFKVYSDKPSNDRLWRDLTCYDSMYDIINADVTEWYSSLEFPMTIKSLRDSFFNHLEIEQEEIDLINDSFVTEGGFVADVLSGKTVIEAICELNGVFGHINKDGVFTYISLPNGNNITYKWYVDGTGNYEDYMTTPISGIRVQDNENDVGTSVGNMVNPYVITSNPLIYGTEGTTELTTALNRLLEKVKYLTYRPYGVQTYGNPMLEIGTPIILHTRDIDIESFVFQRVLNGIQALTDDISADGEEVQSTQVNNIQSQISRTKGKVHEIIVDVDTLSSRITNAEESISDIDGELDNVYTKTETESLVEQTATGIETRVSNTYETKTDATNKLNSANQTAKGYADTAEANAISDTNTKLGNYYNKTETESKISQSATDIETSIATTYETKADANSKLATANTNAQGYATAAETAAKNYASGVANTAENNAKGYADDVASDAEQAANDYTDNQLTNYVTGSEYSTFKQSVEGFETQVGQTYQTISQAQTDYNNLNTAAQGYANTAESNANAHSDAQDAITNARFSNYTTSEAFSTFRQSVEANELAINTKIQDIDSDLLDINGELHGFLLLENGSYLLLEDESKLELEVRYSTLYETASLIRESQTEIELAVSDKYETQTSASEREARLTLSLDGFKVQVSGTYETMANATSKYTEYSSEFSLLEGSSVLKVNSNGNLAFMALSADPASTIGSEITIDADQITMTSSQAMNFLAGGDLNLSGKNISISSNNFSVTSTGQLTSSYGSIGGWQIGSNQLYYEDDSDNYISLYSRGKRIEIVSGGLYKFEAAAGAIGFYYDGEYTAHIRSEYWSGTANGNNLRGVGLNIRPDGYFIDMGYENSTGSGTSVLTINNGLNPNGITQKLIFQEDAMMRGRIYFDNTSRYIEGNAHTWWNGTTYQCIKVNYALHTNHLFADGGVYADSVVATTASNVLLGSSSNNGVPQATGNVYKGFGCYDNTGGTRYVEFYSNASYDGSIKGYIYARNIKQDGTTVTNSLGCGVNKDGTLTYSISSPSRFRDAIGLNGLGVQVEDLTFTDTAQNERWTETADVTLSAGRYLLIGTVGFASNSDGGRYAVISNGSSNGTEINYHARTAAKAYGATRIHIVCQVSISANTHYYLNAYQNSGSSLSTTGRLTAIRLGNQ